MMIDSATNPFVGLRPFESDESLLFFGRQKQVIELMERLHEHQFVAVTGSSGCGKSSLIRAGLIPKLKAGYLVDDRDKWLIAVMKPGENPIYNMSAAILEQVNGIELGIDKEDLQRRVADRGTDAVLDILNPLWDKDINFFLLVDQFEELFPDPDQIKVKTNDEAIDFVNILLELSAQRELPVYIVITMRSDYLGDCAQYYGLPEALNESQYIVPRLNRIQLKSAIEGPIKLFNGDIHPGLTERLLNDSQNVKAELPLLQHVLMRIWDKEKSLQQNGMLELEDYENIGGIEKALSNHAEEALNEMSAEDKELAQKIFQALTRIDEKGRKTRRRVHLEELEELTNTSREKLLFIIECFNKDSRSFITLNKTEKSDDLLIDISHESLITQWKTLNDWVNDEADSATMLLDLARAAEQYNKPIREKDLLRGNELNRIAQWFNSFKPNGVWAKRYKVDFDTSARYLLQSEQGDRRQELRKRWNRRLLFAAVVFVVLLISAFAIVVFVNNIKRKRQLALYYWKTSQAAKAENNYLEALHLNAEAIVLTNDEKFKQNILIDAEAILPRTCLINIFPQPNIINSAVFSANNKLILTACNDGNAYILDKRTGRPVGPGLHHRGPVNSAVYSSDEKWIVTASNDGTSCVWDAVTGKKRMVFYHKLAVMAAMFNFTGKQILTASADSCVYVWDVATGQKIRSIKHAAPVTSAAFNGDGKAILTSCVNGDVCIWDAATGALSKCFHDEEGVKSAVFNSDGTKVLTTGVEYYAYIRDVATNKILSLKKSGVVTVAKFSPDGKWILTADRDKEACLWNAHTGKRAGTSMKDNAPVYCAAFSANGRWIVTSGWDKTIRIWYMADLAESRERKRMNISDKINSACYSSDGRKVVIAADDQYIHVWDVGSAMQADSLKQQAPVVSAVLNPDGTKMLTVGADSTIHFWDFIKKREIAFIKQPFDVSVAVFSPDGKLIVTGSDDGYVRIGDTATILAGKFIDSFVYNGDIKSAMVSYDGKKILIAGGDSAAHLFDLRSHRELALFKHDDIVNDAVFSQDGKQVLTASWDNTVRLWDVESGNQKGPSMKHPEAVKSAVFSSDGQWILTSGFDGDSHLWSTAAQKEIGLGKQHEGPVSSAVFSPDGRSILTAGPHIAHIWEIEGDLDLPPDLFKLQAKAVTGVEYNAETGETQCITANAWYSLKKQYNELAKEHYRKCKYPQYNLWHSFNRKELVP